jgi:hypothetical protein
MTLTLLVQFLAVALCFMAIIAVLIDNEHGLESSLRKPGPDDAPLIGPAAPEGEAESEEPREALKIRVWKP